MPTHLPDRRGTGKTQIAKAFSRKCATCVGAVTPGDTKKGITRCRPCRTATPGRVDTTGRASAQRPNMRRKNISATVCTTCPQSLSVKEVRAGHTRCGKCRFNSHGGQPKPVTSKAETWGEAWWVGRSREAFTSEIAKRFPHASPPITNNIARWANGKIEA